MRRATITLVRTRRARFPGRIQHQGQSVTLERIFAEAGIELRVRKLPRHFDGGREDFNLEQLHRFMRSVGGGSGRWRATVLVVPTITYIAGGQVRTPRGVMFDSGGGNLDGPEREGCAVAVSRASSDLELMRTIAHELGHVFNLVHRHGLGSSLMYTTGQVRAAGGFSYPSNVRFGFEADERAWLSSAAEPLVQPGGSPFRGGSIPEDLEDGEGALAFEVSTRQRQALPGEPIRVRYTLRNMGTSSLVLTGLPTLVSMRGTMVARSPGYGDYALRAPIYSCDDGSPIALRPGARLRWSERLPADPRLDALGSHSIRVRLVLTSDAGSRALDGSVDFCRRIPEGQGELTELSSLLQRPWVRRTLAHESIGLDSDDERAARALLGRYRGFAALDEIRLALAAGLSAADSDPAALLGELDEERLDLEQRLQACKLLGDEVGRAQLEQALGLRESG